MLPKLMSKQAKGCKSECQYWNSSSQIHSLNKKKKVIHRKATITNYYFRFGSVFTYKNNQTEIL